MGKSAVFGLLMFLVVLMIAGASHGDGASSSPPPSLPPSGGAAAEPITGTAAVSAPGDSVPQKDPFSLYDVGPPGTVTWSYNDLTAAEKAWADRNADTTGWPAIQSAYADAAKQLAQQAATDAAAHQLGVTGNLAGTGVVP
jgi:hypothetical protein